MTATVKIGAAVCAAAIAVAGVAAPASAAKGRNDSNAKLCQKGGWQNLYTSDGDTFASEKACTSYAAGGGTLTTTPPPPPHPYPDAKTACEDLPGGGVLTVVNGVWNTINVQWRCDGPSEAELNDSISRRNACDGWYEVLLDPTRARR